MTLRLHVLAGARELLRPVLLPADLAGSLLGERVRVAAAFWVVPRAERYYHDFLLEEPGDSRVEVFARSLREDFGARFEPLVVLPELLGAGTVAAGPALRDPLDVLAEVWLQDAAARLTLWAVGLSPTVDPDGAWAGGLALPAVAEQLASLRTACIARGIEASAVDTAVIDAGPDLPGFDLLHRNALASRIADRMAPGLGETGLRAEADTLRAHVAEVLEQWSRKGLVPRAALDADEVDAIARRALDRIILTEARTEARTNA